MPTGVIESVTQARRHELGVHVSWVLTDGVVVSTGAAERSDTEEGESAVDAPVAPGEFSLRDGG